jgi:hypothetical protein
MRLGGRGYARFVSAPMAMRNFVVARIPVSVLRRSVMTDAACRRWRRESWGAICSRVWSGSPHSQFGYVENV